jgi:cytochrome P450
MFAFTHQYDPALRFANARHMLEVMQALYRELKDAHGTGLINAFINAQIKGRRPTESECGGFILFMFLAGIDTMGSTSAWLLRHLALHPAERRDLIDNPDRRAAFVEEGFRRYATVSPNRFVKKETQICGVTLKPGDNVVVSAPFACMDPARYEDPAAFVMNRKSRNLAFGAGSHFCIGAQLSRLQLPAMLDRWLARIPHFAIAPGCRPTAHMGDVTALDSLPLAWPI